MGDKFDSSYLEYQLNRSAVRKMVRRLYMHRAASQLTGASLDFGCGIGHLLQKLPGGSKGVEYNHEAVKFCRDKGLTVMYYDGFADNWGLSTLPADWTFQSLVISHVLEHLDEPMNVLRALLAAGEGRGISKVLVIVPGMAGFGIDLTHRTFVNIEMLQNAGLEAMGWQIMSAKHFPGNWKPLGNYFPHHELQVLLERG